MRPIRGKSKRISLSGIESLTNIEYVNYLGEGRFKGRARMSQVGGDSPLAFRGYTFSGRLYTPERKITVSNFLLPKDFLLPRDFSRTLDHQSWSHPKNLFSLNYILNDNGLYLVEVNICRPQSFWRSFFIKGKLYLDKRYSLKKRKKK